MTKAIIKIPVKMLTAAAMTSIFAAAVSFTSLAATGWTEEDGEWVYYDRDGERITDQWKKSGSNWFYLDEDGYMLRSSIVEDDDDYFYVNSAGAMVSNEWREVDNEDDSEEDASDTVWYYLQSNGKAYKGSSDRTAFKTINGKKYAFDEEGKMLYGWVSQSSERVTGDDAWREGVYYCGEPEDGAAVMGNWMEINVVDEENEDDDNPNYWFYFKSNGVKVTDSTRTINGRKYKFDENGAAEFKWYSATPNSATASEYQYFNEEDNCQRADGWFQAVPPEDVDKEGYDDDETFWFYAQSNGELITSELKNIKGEKYGFNEYGEMLEGLYKLEFEGNKIISSEEIESEGDLPDNEDTCSVYWFGTSPKDGAMQTGSKTIEIDGEKYTYFFYKSGSKKGRGVEGIYDGSIYIKGRRLEAEKDEKYVAVDFEDNQYLVNTSGKIMKNKKNIKDSDDTYYCTDKNGIIYYQDGEKYDKNAEQ